MLRGCRVAGGGKLDTYDQTSYMNFSRTKKKYKNVLESDV